MKCVTCGARNHYAGDCPKGKENAAPTQPTVQPRLVDINQLSEEDLAKYMMEKRNNPSNMREMVKLISETVREDPANTPTTE